MHKGKVGPIIRKLEDNIQTRHPTGYRSRSGGLALLNSKKGETQTTTDTEIISHIPNKRHINQYQTMHSRQ
jgi:hypothetical protein